MWHGPTQLSERGTRARVCRLSSQSCSKPRRHYGLGDRVQGELIRITTAKSDWCILLLKDTERKVEAFEV